MNTNSDNKVVAQKSFDNATRYMSNAKRELGLAMKNGNIYEDRKHVSCACGIAYKGVLVALDGIFILRRVKRDRGGVSIKFYQSNLAKIDKKMLHSLEVAYQILHVDGYYNEFNDVRALAIGFIEAEIILKKLKQMLCINPPSPPISN